MMANQVYLAVDLGASSGRVLSASFDGCRLTIDETHRFENGPVRVGTSIFWDLLGLWREVLIGLRAAGQLHGRAVASVGVDTWGVDFGLLTSDQLLLSNPYHYRDSRTLGVMERAIDELGREAIFAETGLQFLQFNTLFQLLAMKWSGSSLLEVAHRLLMMPDLFHWLLSGQRTNERTNASTTQFYNPQTADWAFNLLETCGMRTDILGDIAEPGTSLGALLPMVREETGLSAAQVILPATHDTGSAVAAVPASPESGRWCFISSGTWSLMGAELSSPVLSDACREANFTNEVGVNQTIRLLKNIGGLWLLQQSRAAWKKQGRAWSWDELAAMAAEAPPLASLIDPDYYGFLSPSDMPAAIRDYCRDTRQPIPQDERAVTRTIIESLALKYRYVLEALERLVGYAFDTIHIIGGGTKNRLLCQATADACGRRVVAGPVEATAIGNALVQAIAAGAIGNLQDGRRVVRESFAMDEYVPRDTARWDEAYQRFQALMMATP
jgi:rhamnulokinase